VGDYVKEYLHKDKGFYYIRDALLLSGMRPVEFDADNAGAWI
jgi:hypothetical protein